MRIRHLLFSILMFSQLSLFAQEAPATKKWGFLVEPYLMFPTMNGESGIRRLPAISIDADSKAIFSHLDFGGMLYLEARSDKWTIGSDFVYMKLSQDIPSSTLINSGKIEVSQLIWEVSGLYHLRPFLEAGIGLRFNNITMGADIMRNTVGGGATEFASGENSQFWVDPVIIARLTETLNEKWQFQFRADIGGFGIGSDLTWQALGSVGYRFSDLFQTTLGYRIIGMDYEKGSGAEMFMYDVNTSGPLVKFGFNF